MYQIVDGIVLNRANFLDYDKIVILYTLQLGKIKVLFKSVNKPFAKLLSITEPATELELQCVKLKSKDYGYVFKAAGGKILNFNSDLRKDLNIYFYTCKILDLVDALTLELVKDENKFFLIKRVLQVLPASKNRHLLYLAFIYRFIKLCGYMPELINCVKCKSKLLKSNNFFYFDFVDGGVVCEKCFKNNSSLKISFNTTKILQKFYKLNAEQIDKLEVPQDTIEEINKLTFLYLQNYIHRPLRVNNC